MPTVEAVIGKVRAYLGSPDEERLSDDQILHFLYDQNQHYVNLLSLTKENWLVDRFNLDVNASETVYPIPAESISFGTVVHVETNQEMYPRNHTRRKVNVIAFQDLHLVENRSSITAIPETSTEPDSVAAVAFRRASNGWEIVTAPLGARGSYTVWYEIGFATPANQVNEPQMIRAFHGLLAVATAMVCLPFCGWSALDDQSQMRQMQALGESLKVQMLRQEDAFNRYRFLQNQVQSDYIQPFGRNRRAVRRARNPLSKTLDYP